MPGKGIVWERVCNNSRDRLSQDGDLSWCRMHPPVIKVGPGSSRKRGSFLAVRTGYGPPDWIALHNGLSIIGDDKDSKSLRWSTRNVKDHQAKAFDRHESQGGLAVILLRMPDKSRWAIPWKLLRPVWTEKKSLCMQKLVDLGAFQWVHKCQGEPAYDWLTPLLNWRKDNG